MNKNTKCPIRKRCFDYGNCENCDLGDNISKLHKRIDRLKKQNETLTIQRNAWALTAKALTHQWISVEERLPEDFGVFLCYGYLNSNGMSCTSLVQFCGKWIPFDDDDFTVTHWMPLPEAPMMKGEWYERDFV